MDDKSVRTIADELRLAIMKKSDHELFYFKQAIHSGEIKPQPLESVSEFIIRAAKEYKANLPF